MKNEPTEKDLQRAVKFLETDFDIVDHETLIYFDRGERVFDLADILLKYILHLESAGEIKFTANRHIEEPKKKSRCCGRCDGVNDICIGDTFCEAHKKMGCQICWPLFEEPQS